MGNNVDKLGAPPSRNISPSSMKNEITEMITYVRGVSDGALVDLSSALNEFGIENLKPFTYTAPTAPSGEHIRAFNWRAKSYSSQMWVSLYSLVRSDIENGSHGLPQLVYDSIIGREQTARINLLEPQYQKGLDDLGERGFNFSTGQIAVFQKEQNREKIRLDHDGLLALMNKDYDVAIRNKEFSITAGKDIEQMAQSAFVEAEKISFEAAKAAQEYLIAVYEQEIKKFDVWWEGIRAEATAYGKGFELEAKVAEARAAVAAQVIASALGAINTGMTYGYSGSESETYGQKYSESRSNSLSEQHTYQEL